MASEWVEVIVVKSNETGKGLAGGLALVEQDLNLGLHLGLVAHFCKTSLSHGIFHGVETSAVGASRTDGKARNVADLDEVSEAGNDLDSRCVGLASAGHSHACGENIAFLFLAKEQDVHWRALDEGAVHSSTDSAHQI